MAESQRDGDQMCEVSIIIPNWNGGEDLSRCLDSILEHTHGVDFELILIDNGSSDESRSAVEAYTARDPRVTAIFNDENVFFAKACNQGYERSRGRYLLVANNDILLSDDAVSRLVRYADDHPEVGIVTPRFTGRDGIPQEFGRRLPNALHIIAHYHRLGRAVDRFILGRRLQNHYFYRDRDFDEVEEIEQPGASFSLFRRDEIDRLDRFFDEAFPLLFNDVDLCLRLKKKRVVSHVVPEIRVVHLAGISSEKLDPELYLDFLYGAIFDYFSRHHPLQAPLLWLAWPRRWIRHR
ncbi:MAG: glycosyltransferase family 2 protein [Acidobacteria bacterium]|nr:glycosyltransferase family 2 protein [Candidatus Sulfomarinibacter kjeldsenii]